MNDLIKTLSCFNHPALVRYDEDGKIGVSGALLDAFGDDPYLALQLRQKGHRAPVPGIVDCPSHILDALADDLDGPGIQAAALLTGEVDGITFTAPILTRLLHYVPHLPLPSVAALEAPADLARRPFVLAWLKRAVSTGRLPVRTLRGIEHVDRRDYADIADVDSPLIAAWTGRNLPQNRAG